MRTEIEYGSGKRKMYVQKQNKKNEFKSRSEQYIQYESPRSETANASNAADLDTDNIYQHYESSVRLLCIRKSITGSCGFHLTRTKWDPYPWVSAVDAHTAAEISGLKAGDCVLEVNGEDVLGLRITDIAKLVQAKSGHVTLLLWSCGSDFQCNPEGICCAPMPLTLQRLASIVQSILSIIECPVCLDTITPPTMQCQNGHLLCLNCRIRAEKCPVCRDRYTPQRALIAEQIYAAITSAYNLCSGNEDKLRQKLFGQREGPAVANGMKVMTRRLRRAEAAKQTIDEQAEQTEVRKDRKGGRTMKWRRPTTQVDGSEVTQSHHVVPGTGQPGRFSFINEADKTQKQADDAVAKADAITMKRDGRRKKILMKLWHTKAVSMENLTTTTTTKARSSGLTSDATRGMSEYINGLTSASATTLAAGEQHPNVNAVQLFPNRSIDEMDWAMKNSQNHSNSSDNNNYGPYKATEVTMAIIKGSPLQTWMRKDGMEMNMQKDIATKSTMPLNSEITILNVTKPTTNDATSKLLTASPRTPFASDSKSKALQLPPPTTKNDKRQHVEPPCQYITWQLQQKHSKSYATDYHNIQYDNSTSATTPGTPSPPVQVIALRHCPSSLQRSQELSPSIFNDNNSNNNSKYGFICCPSSSSSLFIDKRRPASNRMSLSSSSIEYLKASYVHCSSETDQLLPADIKTYNKNTINNTVSDNDANSTQNSNLTPASSLSSGVFFTNSPSPNDLQVSILAKTTTQEYESCNDGQQQQQRQQNSTEITAITMHKNALLSSVSRLGRPASSITSSLRSLSSLTSSLFSSASDLESPLPLIAAASVGACSSASTVTVTAPVVSLNSASCICGEAPSSSTSCSPSFVTDPSPLPHLFCAKSPLLFTELCKAVTRYRCPFDGCSEYFDASTQLQRHVKAVHRVPILSFGRDEHAKITVPLRQRLENAMLILETSKSESTKNIIDNNNNNTVGNAYNKEDNAFSDVCRKVGEYKDNRDCVGEPNDIDTQAARKSEETEQKIIEDVHSKHVEKQLEQTRECWIRIKVDDCVASNRSGKC